MAVIKMLEEKYMLYLFNSGARPEYVKNVLHTLHLPKGAINKYQYEIDRTNYVDRTIKYPSKKEVEKVLIVFIDRHDDNPDANKYIPLRYGELKRIELKESKVFFYVKLCDYISEPRNFQKKIKEKFCDKLFYKKGKKEYGHLAFKGEDIIGDYVSDDNDWIKTVKNISECSYLKDTKCIFTKFTLKDKNSKTIAPTIKNGEWSYKLKKYDSCKMDISYYIPFAEEMPNAETVGFKANDFSKNYLNDPKQTLGAQLGSIESSLINCDDIKKDFTISYLLEPSNTNVNIEYSDKPIPFTFVKTNWFLRFIPFAIFAISTFVSTLLATLNNHVVEVKENMTVFDTIANEISTLHATEIALYLAICAILEALSLLWVKKLVDKK